jgi:peroxiredoxin Q/BCP
MSQSLLAVGSQVPEFPVKDQEGNAFSLKDHQGKKVILYFYPKDNTPTCTTEACNLRDNYSLLQEKGYVVLGVSPDSERKHQNFIKKYELPFTLITDPEHKLAEAFGAWGEKKMYGKTYMGILRSTFVIDEAGKVSHVIGKVKAKDHTNQILEEVEG